MWDNQWFSNMLVFTTAGVLPHIVTGGRVREGRCIMRGGREDQGGKSCEMRKLSWKLRESSRRPTRTQAAAAASLLWLWL